MYKRQALNTTNKITAASATAITADELISLQASVKQAYQKDACWIMNPTTFTMLRKLKDGNNKMCIRDSLYSATINRYCLIQAECLEFIEKREMMYQQMIDLEEDKESFRDRDDLTTYYKLQAQMQKSLLALDRQVQAKRKMLLDIEKENIMTIASSLRSVPKKAEKKMNPLLEALNGS